MTVINVAVDFARYPFGRFRSDGDYSGERFRQEFLEPALNKDDQEITIELTGAHGLGSSFLEEAFGGLIRVGFDQPTLKKRMKIVSQDATRIAQIDQYIAEAANQKSKP